MGLFEIPDPVSMFESWKNAGAERAAAEAMFSASLSAFITFTWRSGDAKIIDWAGEGQAMKDSATSMYLSLTQNKQLSWLVLTVPQDMLAANNLSRFQTQQQEKKS